MELKSKMPGKVDSVNVKVGDAVKKGDTIMVVEAMKMKNPMPAPVDGTVKEIKAAGDRVKAGEILAVIEE